MPLHWDALPLCTKSAFQVGGTGLISLGADLRDLGPPLAFLGTGQSIIRRQVRHLWATISLS